MVQQVSRVLAVAIVVAAVWPLSAYAQYSSTNYKVEETFMGNGGELEQCSTAYCSRQSAGELTTGNVQSSSFQANSGFNTTDTELLEVTVNGGVIDFGVLNTSGTAADSVTFRVRNYLSSGYVVTINGTPPQYAGLHTLANMAAPNPSTPGTEQFGINLVANTTPGIGADPYYTADNSSAVALVYGGYNNANNYKFNDGDIIASSTASTSEVLYTISMIANIATSTPGGQYEGTLVVQVVATF